MTDRLLHEQEETLFLKSAKLIIFLSSKIKYSRISMGLHVQRVGRDQEMQKQLCRGGNCRV